MRVKGTDYNLDPDRLGILYDNGSEKVLVKYWRQGGQKFASWALVPREIWKSEGLRSCFDYCHRIGWDMPTIKQYRAKS